jgi:hypothetical protein
MQLDTEGGTQDDPGPRPKGLQETEEKEIKTVPADNSIYAAAASFEDLNLSPELLQASTLPARSCS